MATTTAQVLNDSSVPGGTGQNALNALNPFASISALRNNALAAIGGTVQVAGIQGGQFYYNASDTASGWTGTATISGTALTLASTTSGVLQIGMFLNSGSGAQVLSGSGLSWTLDTAPGNVVSATAMTADDNATYVVDSSGRRLQRIAPSVFSAHYGVPQNAGVDITQSLQRWFTFLEDTGYTLARSGYMPDGIYKTNTGVLLGNPLTNVSGASQGPGIYALFGSDRQRCNLQAIAGCTGTLAKRNNIAGVTIEKIGFDANSIAAIALDLSWGSAAGGPSPENVLRDIYINAATNTNLKIDNGSYDCTIDSIRSVGAPISMSMMSGGGASYVTNSNFSSAIVVSGQNINLINCAMFGGIVISGNTNNIITIEGEQIFPIPTNTIVQAAGGTAGYAIDATNSGTYGAQINLRGLLVNATSSCIKGKFGVGGRFEDCAFTWGSTVPFFGTITTGLNGKPFFSFRNCVFNEAGQSPYSTWSLGAGWDFEMVNCYLADGGGTRIEYYNSRLQGTWTPTIVGSTTAGANTYTVQAGSWKLSRDERTVTAYFDVQINVKDAAMAGTVEIGGLPFTVGADPLNGAASMSLIGLVTLTAGYTQLTCSPQSATTAAAFFQGGSGQALLGLPASGVVNSTRLAGYLTYSIS